MNLARKMGLAVVAMFLFAAGAARAQIISLVPANAWVVIKVSNLDATSQKIADLAKVLGIDQMQPMTAHPLDAFLDSMHVKDGVNRAGDLAIVYLDPTAYQTTPDQTGLVIVPITDYQAFLGNFKDAKTDGDITEIENPNTAYVAHWGDYAVISPVHDAVLKKPDTALTLPDAAAKEWDSKDIVIAVNVPALRPKAGPMFDQAKQAASDFLDQQAQRPAGPGNPMGMMFPGGDMTKLSPVLKVVANELIDLAHEYVDQTDAVTYGIKIAPDGISTTGLLVFQPDSWLGKLTAEAKDTDASFLTGLPDAKYLMLAGAKSDPDVQAEALSHILDPIQKGIADLGPDYASLNDLFPLVKSMVAATTGSNFGMVAPSGALGQQALVQIIAIKTGDAKTLLDDTHKGFDLQQNLMTTLGIKQQYSQESYQVAAKTVDGVTFDDAVTTFNMAGVGPGRNQATLFLNYIYGPGGMNLYSGAVTDSSLLTESGLDDTTLSAAIAAIKNGDDPVAKSSAIKAVAAQLPTQRMAEFYLPLDVWASTGLNYAKQLGTDMGVKLQDDLPPIGGTISTDGSNMRIDGYVPTELIQALTSAGLQVYMAMHQQANPAGPPGGGL